MADTLAGALGKVRKAFSDYCSAVVCALADHAPATDSLTIHPNVVHRDTIRPSNIIREDAVITGRCRRCGELYFVGTSKELPARQREKELMSASGRYTEQQIGKAQLLRARLFSQPETAIAPNPKKRNVKL